MAVVMVVRRGRAGRLAVRVFGLNAYSLEKVVKQVNYFLAKRVSVLHYRVLEFAEGYATYHLEELSVRYAEQKG